MDYATAKAQRDAIEADVRKHGEVLKTFPRGAMGLPPDHVRNSPEYKTAKKNHATAFDHLRKFNTFLVKNFSDEMGY